MSTTICSISVLSSNPISLFRQSFHITCPGCRKFLPNTPSIHKPLVLNCISSSSGERETGGNKLKNALSGIVGKQVEELLNREENRGLLDGLEKATERVEIAKRELAEIERQEVEAKLLREYVDQLETRASEIAECQQEILEAKAMVEEAELSLSLDGDEVGDESLVEGGVGKDRERLESVKAAIISAIVGTFAGIPISLTQVSNSSELILPLGITFISCALFGITYRYTIRRDFDDNHLKTGICAAFGVVKGLATLGGGLPLELNIESFSSHAVNGAVYVTEDLLIFLFAGIGLDFCFKTTLLSPFPMRGPLAQKLIQNESAYEN